MNNKFYTIFAIILLGAVAFAQGNKEDKPFTGVRAIAAANDECATPVVIDAMGDTAGIDTTGHTDDAGDPATACSSWNGTTWYTFTPTADGTIDIDVCSSDYDTVLNVYTGTCGAFTSVDCNDDYCGLQSGVTNVAVVAGTTYTICVGDYGSTAGGGNLIITLSGDDVMGGGAVAADVPTMSEYALFSFIAMFAVAGVFFLRRKN